MSGQTPEQIEQSFRDLDYTQGVRKALLAKVTPVAEGLDKDALTAASKLLDGMDKVSIGRLRLNEQAKENETAAAESAALSNYLIGLSDRRKNSGEPEPTHNAVLDRKLPEARRPSMTDGVLDKSASSENNADFMARMENKTK